MRKYKWLLIARPSKENYISINMFRFLMLRGCVILSTFLSYNFLMISLWFCFFRMWLPFLLCIIFINEYERFQLCLCVLECGADEFIFNLVFNIFGPLCACKHAFNKLLNYGRYLLLLVEFCYNIGIAWRYYKNLNIQVYSNVLIKN